MRWVKWIVLGVLGVALMVTAVLVVGKVRAERAFAGPMLGSAEPDGGQACPMGEQGEADPSAGDGGCPMSVPAEQNGGNLTAPTLSVSENGIAQLTPPPEPTLTAPGEALPSDEEFRCH